MEEVSLQEMLAARERRCYLQTQLLHQYKKSLISFTLNIPGPVKVLTDVPEAFASGCQRIETLLKDRLVLIQHMETIKEKTGYEAFYSVDANPDFIKELMVSLEDQDRLAACLILMYSARTGARSPEKIWECAPRTCLLCGTAGAWSAAEAAGTALQN